MARQTIGEFLQTLRKANGYTQQEVAEKLGISNKTLSSWETDRSYPDLLCISALADLYGVTADEILRGERGSAKARGDNGGEAADKISDKCGRAALKNRYIKFNTASHVLLIPVCASAALIIPAMFVSSTAGIVLLILAVIALVSAAVLQTAFYKNALISADISDGGQLSPAQLDYVRDVKNTLYRCIKTDGWVYLALSVVLLVIGLIYSADSSRSVTVIYYVTDITSAACGVAALAVAEKYAERKPPEQYTEQQRELAAKNNKLFAGCVIGAVTACALFLLAAGALLNCTFSKTEELYRGTREEVKHYLQSVVIETDSALHKDYGVPVAAYYIDLPDGAERYTTYYFDNGFEGVYSYNGDSWAIYYSPEGQGEASVAVSNAYSVEMGDTTVYNVRYGALAVTDNSLSERERAAAGEGIYYLTPEYYVSAVGDDSDTYVLKSVADLYIYDGYVVWGSSALAAAAVIVSAIIYFARRKKTDKTE